MDETRRPFWQLDRAIEFLLYLTIAVVPLVYYNNPIATEYFFSKAFFFVLLVYGAVFLFLLRAALRRELTIRWGYTFLPLALFCLVALQSLIGATNVWKGWETIVRVGACIPFMFLLYQEVGTRQGVLRSLAVAAIVNIGVTGYGFLQFFEVFPLPRDQYGTADPSTTIGLTNFVMEYLSPFMFVMPLMVIIAKRRSSKLLFLTATLFQSYYFFISDNRAAMVALAGSLPIAVVLFYNQYKRGSFRFGRSTVAVAAALGVIAVMTLVVSPLGQRFVDRAKSILETRGGDAAITFRIETWKQSLSIIGEHPVRGVGLSNLEVEFPKYQSEFLEGMTLRNNTRVVRAHNEYVQVVADLGLLGAAVFAWFLFMLGRLLLNAYRRNRSWDDLLLVTGLALGVSTYLIIAFFAFPFEVPASALSIFFIIGLLEILTRRVHDTGDGSGERTFAPQFSAPIAWTAAAFTLLFWLYASNWMWNVLRAEVYFKESRVMKDLKQWDVAKSLLDDAIKHYPQNEAYYYDRSIFAIRKGDIRGALKDLKQTAKLVPNYAMGHKQMGLLAAQLGDYREAAARFEKAYSIYKHSHDDFVPLLINAYIGAGMTDDALRLAQRSTTEHSSPEVRLSVAQAYISSQDYASAVSHLTDAVEERPDYADALAFLGIAYNGLGEHERALQALNKVNLAGLTGKQTKNTVAYQRVKALVALERIAEAREIIKTTLADDPTSRRLFSTDPAVQALLDQ